MAIDHRPRQAGPPSLPETVARLRADMRRQQTLSALFEGFADALPTPPPAGLLMRAGTALADFAERRRPHGERLLDTAAGQAELRMLSQLHEFQLADLGQAEETLAALWDYAQSRPAPPVEQLGYMLRGCFEGWRRAIALAEALLARWDPLAR